jgi:diphthamide biosynthesis methyltransferase
MLFYDCAFIGVNSPEIFTFEWCKANDAVLNDFYTSLEDVRSQETLLAYLNQRICAREGITPSNFIPSIISRRS